MSQRPFQPLFPEHDDDLSILKDGRPRRIRVIPRETGRTNERVILEGRRQDIARSAVLPSPARNPRMRGTTHALRRAVGRELGKDSMGETLALLGQSAPVHLFNCDAMANVRLCSASDTGTSTSKGTTTMSRNCRLHLPATITIPEPTLCIIQGLRVANALAPVIERRRWITNHLDRVQVAGGETLLATFTHPSATNLDQHWRRLTNARYLWKVVEATIQRARRELTRPTAQSD